MSTASGAKTRAADAAHGAATVAWSLALLYAIAGIFAGFFIGFHDRTKACTSAFCSGDQHDHPYVGLGIGVAFAALFTAAIVVMVADYIQFRTVEFLSADTQEDEDDS